MICVADCEIVDKPTQSLTTVLQNTLHAIWMTRGSWYIPTLTHSGSPSVRQVKTSEQVYEALYTLLFLSLRT